MSNEEDRDLLAGRIATAGRVVADGPSTVLKAEAEHYRQRVEVEAEGVYSTWADQENWVPWVPRGNSDKQEQARLCARRRLASAPTPTAGDKS